MKPFATIFLLLTLSACSGDGDRYDATGTFETTEVVVSAEASGKLLRMDVEEGMKLEAGQAVGQVDTVQLYLKKLQLEASARSVSDQRPDIRKQIAATQEQICQAERERDRVKRLLVADAANRKQLDDAESLLQVLRKQLAAQNSSLQNSDRSLSWQSSSVDIQVAQVDDQLAKCRVCAPWLEPSWRSMPRRASSWYPAHRSFGWATWNGCTCVPMSPASSWPKSGWGRR